MMKIGVSASNMYKGEVIVETSLNDSPRTNKGNLEDPYAWVQRTSQHSVTTTCSRQSMCQSTRA